MPNFKNSAYFQQNTSSAFDNIHHPGQLTQNSGIYRCTSCGFEVTSVEGKPLPPENSCDNHSHTWKSRGGHVRWQLAAAAIHVSN